MSARFCPCGRELVSAADLARGVCSDCRVTAKKRRRGEPEQVDDEPGLFDVEPEERRLVELPGLAQRSAPPTSPRRTPAHRQPIRSDVRRDRSTGQG